MIRTAVVGGAGYVGGDLIRLLLGHPRAELAAVTSRSRAGRRVDGAHPNLRGLTDLTFVHPDDLKEYDVVFLAVPHGQSMAALDRYAATARTLIDLTGDFRLTDPEEHRRYYGTHKAPHEMGTFVYGLPELHRKELREADRISVPGCMAAAGILAVHPLAADQLIEGAVSVDARTGSSGSGAAAVQENLHAERSGALRVYAPAGHRHEAEIRQATGLPTQMTATAVEAVRGVQVLCRVTLAEGVQEREVRASYRRHYADEPFVRIIAQRRGLHRYPDPKILLGSNFCDVGFAVEPAAPRALLIAALDNLVKGAGGNAVQAMNIRYALPERLGLEFPGLHPI